MKGLWPDMDMYPPLRDLGASSQHSVLIDNVFSVRVYEQILGRNDSPAQIICSRQVDLPACLLELPELPGFTVRMLNPVYWVKNM